MSDQTTVDLCFWCGLRMEYGAVLVHDSYGLQKWHPHCFDERSREVKAAEVGDIVDSWLVDGAPADHSVKFRVSEIACITELENRTIKHGVLKVVCIPVFTIRLRGSRDTIACHRQDSHSLLSPEQSPDSENVWLARPQPSTSPTFIATKKFRDDLIIAWAEAIKAERARPLHR